MPKNRIIILKINCSLFLLLTIVVLPATKVNGQAKQKIDYLGQKPPGMKAALFGKGTISTDSVEHSSPAFSPDGKVVIWTIASRPSYLLEMRNENGVWSKPAIPSFDDAMADDLYPSFSTDGKKLYFSSRRKMPWPNMRNDISIWEVERTSTGWGNPVPFDTTVSTGTEYAHSITKNGSWYFSSRKNGGRIFDIYYSKKENGNYTIPLQLPYNINTTETEDGPFIAPDESYLIFESSRPGGYGSNDLYICFKNKKNEWSLPLNMGPQINTPRSERFAKVSPDGKYLFFGRDDIYWIDAKIIGYLKKTVSTSGHFINTSTGKEVLSALYENNPGKAAGFLKQMLLENPADDFIAIDYAKKLRQSLQFGEAEKVLKTILTKRPGDATLLTEMVLISYNLNKPDEAEKYMDGILQTGADKQGTFISVGTMLLTMKLYDASILYFEKALVIQPRGGDFYNVACAYSLSGNKNKAFENLDKAIENGFNSKQQFETDTDLATLKSDSRWQKLLMKVK